MEHNRAREPLYVEMHVSVFQLHIMLFRVPSGEAERCGINVSIPPVMANPYVIGNERLVGRAGMARDAKKRDR